MKFCRSTSSPGTGHSHKRGKGRKRGRGEGKGKSTLVHPLVPLVGEVGEGEATVDEVVEDEETGMVGTPLQETEHGRTRTKPTVAITIGNATMTRRWPALDDPRGYTYSLYCLCLLMRVRAFYKY